MSAWIWAKATAKLVVAIRWRFVATLAILIGITASATAQTFTPFALPDNQSTPNAITKGPGNTLWFTDPGTNSVGRITTAGVITMFPLPSPNSSPQGIVLGSDGALWFAEGGNPNPPFNPARIGRIDPALATHDNPQIQEYSTSNNAGAGAISSGPDGNIWVVHDAEISRVIERFPIAGGAGEVYFFPDPQPPHDPICVIYPGRGIAAEVGNSLLFTGTTCGSRSIGLIGRVTPGGGLSVVVDENSGLPGLPIGIIPGSDGAFWFTADTAKIGRVTSAGGVTIFDVLGGHIATTVFGLAAGSDGALWLVPNFNCCGSMSIRHITTAGVVTEYADPAVDGFNGNFNGVTIGPDGHLWFTQQGARIGRMTVPGNISATTTLVGSSPNPSVVGQNVTFTATVSDAGATGTVSFDFGDGSPADFITIGAGPTTASHSFTLGAGFYSVTATYSGDTSFASSTSSVLSQSVGKGATTTSIGASPNPSVVGQSVTFTATVSDAGATGTVSFDFGDGSPADFITIGAAPITASHSFTLGAGFYSVTATYSGDASFHASTSSVLSQSVGQNATTTAVTSSAKPSVFGQSVTFTATVTGSGATGTVTFKDGGSPIGSHALSAGTAMFSISSLGVGSHTITAVYAGSADFLTSTSSGFAQTVGRDATSTSVKASPTHSVPGHSVSFTATVAVVAPGTGMPTGNVTFKEGAKTLGTGALSSRSAHISTSSLTIGSHTITATYAGDAKNAGGSATQTVTVSAMAGAETKANTTTSGAQSLPAAAALANGYALVWASGTPNSGIYMQLYNASGGKIGSQAKVNTTAAGNPTQPAIAKLANNSFVVAWQSSGIDGSGLGIYAQRRAATGAKAGMEFRINTTKTGNQFSPAVAGLSGGGFVAVWASSGGAKGLGVYGQRYDNNGKAVGVEFSIAATPGSAQPSPVITGLTGGSFVVSWQATDANGLGVYMRRYDAAGQALDVAKRVNTATAHDQSLPSIAPLSKGSYAIAWQSALQDGSGLGTYLQVFNASGVHVGSEQRINTTTTNDQAMPALAALRDGGLIALWMSKGQDGAGQGIFVQAFKNTGAKVNVEFRANTTTAGDQIQPAVAALTAGQFFAAWTSANDGSGQGISFQRFTVPGTQ